LPEPTRALPSDLSAESVTRLAVGYNYGIWTPPPTGLPPVGTAAGCAARFVCQRLCFMGVINFSVSCV
jgi:hypothetical protein